ncbi:hypothetical protein FRC19_011706 [Serendipita sp. 401]|nr:hypothetical protein FRC16_007034 [Serendipita sp. 398]KAG8816935.1 hypothetical protein FRC19_011706 [Serendipita sp. 401]
MCRAYTRASTNDPLLHHFRHLRHHNHHRLHTDVGHLTLISPVSSSTVLLFEKEEEEDEAEAGESRSTRTQGCQEPNAPCPPNRASKGARDTKAEEPMFVVCF